MGEDTVGELHDVGALDLVDFSQPTPYLFGVDVGKAHPGRTLRKSAELAGYLAGRHEVAQRRVADLDSHSLAEGFRGVVVGHEENSDQPYRHRH